MTASHSNEFVVDPDLEGQGTLIITDAALLIRPAVPGQYHGDVAHDSGRVNTVMDLGDIGDGNCWHIVTSLNVTEAHQLLDRAFYTYVDYYCMAKIWVDALVSYIDADGSTKRTKKYGFTDGSDTLYFNVYCGYAPETDCRELLQRVISTPPDRQVKVGEMEHFFGSNSQSASANYRVVVVSPSNNEARFVARGFIMSHD